MPEIRKRFYCRLLAEDGSQIATSIQVILPPGLTRYQAIEFVTGRIAAEVGRYAAHEALGLSHITNDSPFEPVT